MKYIAREDNIPEILINSGEETLDSKLKKEYDYIYSSMKDEGYSIRFNDFNLFSEILFDSKVVGFATYVSSKGNTITMNEIYILPQFRGNRLFLQELMQMQMSTGRVSFNQPTRNLVEILIHYNLAVRIKDNLVVSAFVFAIRSEHILCYGDFDMEDMDCFSNIYDLNLCSPLFTMDITTPGACQFAYQEILDDDDKHYSCREFRQSIDTDRYFQSLKEEFLNNGEDYNSLSLDLRNKLPNIYSNYETVFGDGEGLSDFMRLQVKDGLISESDAVKLIDKLKKEYDSGIVKDEGLIIRLLYLLNGYDLSEDTELFLKNISKTTDLCPYCYQPVSPLDSYCEMCGCDISDGRLLDCDKVISEISQKDPNIVDLRHLKSGEAFNKYPPLEESSLSQDEITECLVEFYKNNDEEGFKNFIKENPIGITDISQIENLEEGVFVDLSSHMSCGEAEYVKNYYPSAKITDRVNASRHVLNEDKTQKGPTYSLRMTLLELEKNPNLSRALDSADINIDRDYLVDCLFKYNLIESKKFGEDFWIMVYRNYKVVELKDVLRKNDLKVSGNKMDLVLRLQENNMYSPFGEEDFQITENGEEVLRATSWIDAYDNSMECFDRDDFERYVGEYRESSFIQNQLNYLNQHLKIAYRENDFSRLHDVFSAKAMIYVYDEDFKKALIEELQLYMLRLNPVFLSSPEMESYQAFQLSNMNNILVLSQLAGIHNLKKIFSKTWSYMQFKKRLVSKKECLKYLNRAIGGENLEDLSCEIADKYF